MLSFSQCYFHMLCSFFQRSYGSSNESDIATVKKIYNDLHLQKVYRSYEEQTVNDISDLINRYLLCSIIWRFGPRLLIRLRLKRTLCHKSNSRSQHSYTFTLLFKADWELKKLVRTA